MGESKMKAKITLPNIKGFIQGNFRKALKDMNFVSDHIKEQATWRLNQVQDKSPECVNADECYVCGCTLTGKVWEDRGCSKKENPCYPKMMDLKAWYKFKKKNNISITSQ